MIRIRVSILIIQFFVSGALVQAQSVKEHLGLALARLPHPQTVADFSPACHFGPMNQDSTLVCWSFATSSFIESEMQRLGKDTVRLSVMFPVYYAFVEKTKRFVRSHGESRFNPGDLFSGVLDIAARYGAVPEAAYEGEKSDKVIYDHHALYEDLDSLMSRIRSSGNWNEERAVTEVESILDGTLGKPPEKFVYREKEYTPNSFLSEIVDLPWNEYVTVTSFQYAPFDRFIELRVPDNWKHNANYFNVPLNVFYTSLRDAIARGYSAAIDMDNSESSYRMTKQYAFIPEYEVPEDSITQALRERQFQSGATTDDHVMHIIAYRKFGTEDWFLAKDSWRTAWEGQNHGYFFFHESYVKLKVLAYLVHKDGVPEIARLLPAK
jgi:bleomycin hydrolase